MLDKNSIRKEILAIRKDMSSEDVISKSNSIVDKLLSIKEFKNAVNICMYYPINNEVDLTSAFPRVLSMNKTLWLPKITNSFMEFYPYEGENALREGAFHIMEPVSDKILVPDSNTLIVMPGSVFSVKYDRIGYGGGYYDRYLDRYPLCKTAAVCYSFQIVQEFEVNSYDVRPEILIHENSEL